LIRSTGDFELFGNKRFGWGTRSGKGLMQICGGLARKEIEDINLLKEAISEVQ